MTGKVTRGSLHATWIFVAAVALVVASACAATPPTAGSAAPEFTLQSQDDKPISLKNFRGQWVVLYFSPSNFNERGTQEAEAFQRDLPQYAHAKAAIINVSTETEKANRTFAAKEKLTFPLLTDTEAKVAHEYGSTMYFHMNTLPARNTFIIDPNGRVAQVFTQVVDTQNHSRDILRALASLQHH